LKNLADYVMIVDHVLTEDFCNSLIERFEAQETKLTNNTWGNHMMNFHELNITKHADFAEESKLFYDLTQDLFKFYIEKNNVEFMPSKIGYEDARMKRYDPNGIDQFGWHTDVGDYASAKRFLVMFYYLNDVEEGGQTVFNDVTYDDKTNLTINARRGRIVIFPPMWMYPHKGMPPISNSKYIISTYCHYL